VFQAGADVVVTRINEDLRLVAKAPKCSRVKYSRVVSLERGAEFIQFNWILALGRRAICRLGGTRFEEFGFKALRLFPRAAFFLSHLSPIVIA